MENEEEKSGIDLDLDALAPKQIQINYKGALIKINPLTLEQFGKLYDVAADMKDIRDDRTKLKAVMIEVEALIKDVIPELKEEKLNQIQLTALINLLSELSTPEDKALAELKKRGIELKKGDGADSDPKDLTS